MLWIILTMVLVVMMTATILVLASPWLLPLIAKACQKIGIFVDVVPSGTVKKVATGTGGFVKYIINPTAGFLFRWQHLDMKAAKGTLTAAERRERVLDNPRKKWIVIERTEPSPREKKIFFQIYSGLKEFSWIGPPPLQTVPIHDVWVAVETVEVDGKQHKVFKKMDKEDIPTIMIKLTEQGVQIPGLEGGNGVNYTLEMIAFCKVRNVFLAYEVIRRWQERMVDLITDIVRPLFKGKPLEYLIGAAFKTELLKELEMVARPQLEGEVEGVPGSGIPMVRVLDAVSREPFPDGAGDYLREPLAPAGKTPGTPFEGFGIEVNKFLFVAITPPKELIENAARLEKILLEQENERKRLEALSKTEQQRALTGVETGKADLAAAQSQEQVSIQKGINDKKELEEAAKGLSTPEGAELAPGLTVVNLDKFLPSLKKQRSLEWKHRRK